MHKLRRRTFIFALIILGFAGFGLWSSCWGRECWGPNTHDLYEADLVGIGFHSLFFLVPAPDSLNITLQHKHWALYVALFLSPLFTLSVLLEILRTFASDNFARLRLKFWQEHTVIFGGGGRARALLDEYKARDQNVVVFSDTFTTETLVSIQGAGFPYMQAKPSNLDMLKKARLPKASRVIVADDDDLKNLDLSSFIKSHLEENKSSEAPSNIHCLVLNDDFQSLVIPNSRKIIEKQEVRINLMKTAELAARRFAAPLQLFAKALDAGSDRMNLAFIGFGPQSVEVLKQLLKISLHPDLQTPRVVVFSESEKSISDNLASLWPELHMCADFEFHDIADVNGYFLDLNNRGENLSLVFVEYRDYYESLLTAVKLRDKLHLLSDESVPVVYVSKSSGVTTPDDNTGNLISYDPIEAETILSAIEGHSDVLAEKIHRAYLAENTQRLEQASGDTHAYVEWEKLGEDYRSNNRRAADHIPAKRHASGIENPSSGLALDADGNLEKLATLEHDAWSMDRRLSGWRLGPRDNSKKTHPDLIAYENLTEEIKGYDRQQVKFIDRILRNNAISS
ncbi:RyR domain-containing protein [Hellea sp.]|nr:RyR domain-containing protein [Hellea sp.]